VLVDRSIRMALWVRAAGESEPHITSQRQCQNVFQAHDRKALIPQEFMVMSSHVQAQDLRQSSPFFVEGPQKRPNLNVLSMYQRVSGGIALVRA